MSGKAKNFPLSLAAVVDKSSPSQRTTTGTGNQRHHSQADTKKIATPQTATRNVAGNQAPKNTGWMPAQANSIAPVTHERSRVEAQSPEQERVNPLASEAIRRAMVARVAKQGVQDAMVLEAMQAVQRHLFMEPALISQAYIDASIPIGHHQTISQPYIVARMIEVMRNGRQMNRVLEIGTGCGYQAAVLSCLAREVYSIERIKPLHELAKANLRPMRIVNLRLHYGDGMLGLPQVAPFDGIILAAAGLEVPPGLLQQLAIGGRLVAPVGAKNQVLQLVERVSKTEWRSLSLEGCHFVPLCPGVV